MNPAYVGWNIHHCAKNMSGIHGVHSHDAWLRIKMHIIAVAAHNYVIFFNQDAHTGHSKLRCT